MALDCEVIGCSTDTIFSHMEFDQKPREDGGLGGLDIPLIGDISKDVADSFGVLVREGDNKGVAFRYEYGKDRVERRSSSTRRA